MSDKVILILVDGMGSHYLKSCTHPFIKQMVSDGASNLFSTTVMPSVTLPCHMSLFHSVPPQRHGILTNDYVPQVRPVRGLLEQLRKFGKSAASFYNWEQLRDLSRPDSLAYSCYISLHQYTGSDALLTARAVEYIRDFSPDFLFLYLGQTDEAGHADGWGSEGYHQTLHSAWDCIEQVCRAAGNDYKILVTADHGGHDYIHGTEEPLDMQIPILLRGVPAEAASAKLTSASILDIAPTIAHLLGVESDKDWRGQSLV